MNKIINSLVVVVITVCLAISFVGCSEKARSTEDIQTLTTTIVTEYANFFDDGGNFKVEYSESVQKLIQNNEDAKILTNYLLPIAKASYDFFNITKETISDDVWKEEDRIDIYNGLNNLKKSLNDFNNDKDRFEDALSAYNGGEVNNIQYSNLINFIKEYGKFIGDLQKFVNQYVEIYFENYAPQFYEYDGTATLSANDLQVSLSHLAFTIAKTSYDLEFDKYYDINSATFSQTVKSGESTKLCAELNKVTSLNSKASSEITDATKKQAYKDINNSINYYLSKLQVFNSALKSFDFEKMKNSEDVEEVYISKLSYEKQQVYNEIMYIAFDYIPQVVLNFQIVYNNF